MLRMLTCITTKLNQQLKKLYAKGKLFVTARSFPATLS
jgi:hypothetical protein